MAGNGFVEVYKDTKGEWRWRRVAANRETVAASGEGYVHKSHAVSMADKLNPDVEVIVKEEQ